MVAHRLMSQPHAHTKLENFFSNSESGQLASEYVKRTLSASNPIDRIYGPRFDDDSDKWYIGNLELKINSNDDW